MTTKYSPLSTKESSRDSDSFSDAEAATALEQNVSMRNLNWRSLRSPLIISICLSIFLMVMLGLGSWLILQESSDKKELPTPRLPAETVTFQNYSDFSGAPTSENNALWMDLIGPGMGFVPIQNPSQYGLPEGLTDDRLPPDVQVYGISMYHQLHCLMMIRDLYWSAIRGERNLKMTEVQQREELLKGMHHVNHCFDYIRQAIMCAGDMTIESAAEVRPNDEHPHINGYGSSHECKNYQVSREWMDANVPEDSWIQ